jgi:ribonuclease P protein component
MLAKKHRLNLSIAENSQLFSKSERFSTDNLLFYYQTNQSCLKVAALAPSRLYKKASERNQKRRLIYQLIEQIDQEHKTRAEKDLLSLCLDLIIVYKKNKTKTKDLENELKIFFDKIVKNNETL